MNGNRHFGKQEYYQAYLLLKLMKKDKQMRYLQREYKEWYGEELFINNEFKTAIEN